MFGLFNLRGVKAKPRQSDLQKRLAYYEVCYNCALYLPDDGLSGWGYCGRPRRGPLEAVSDEHGCVYYRSKFYSPSIADIVGDRESLEPLPPMSEVYAQAEEIKGGK